MKSMNNYRFNKRVLNFSHPAFKASSILLIITVFLILYLTCCRKDVFVITDTLDKLNWSDRNYQVLNQLINDYGKGGKYFTENETPYTVLDWDQTCAHFDVEEAIMRHQLFNLRYKMTKESFSGLLKDNINGTTQLSADFRNVSLADLNQDLISDYNFLYDNYSGLKGTKTLEEIKTTPQYTDFIAKIPFLYDGYCATAGIGADYGYLWILYLFEGLTIEEVRTLAKESISRELANQLSKQTIVSPAGLQTKAGIVSYSYKTGLRIFPEMQNLIATFKSRGIETFIVSASYKPVVEIFAGIGSYGYNVPPENVIAMELATANDGKIMAAYKTGWVKTVRQGKVDAINLMIKVRLNRKQDPIFSACDSDGDYEMSSAFTGMKLTLIWNRVKGVDIGKLCQQAVNEMNVSTPRYILQGRNENTGIAIPSSESILFGMSEPLLLYK